MNDDDPSHSLSPNRTSRIFGKFISRNSILVGKPHEHQFKGKWGICGLTDSYNITSAIKSLLAILLVAGIFNLSKNNLALYCNQNVAFHAQIAHSLWFKISFLTQSNWQLAGWNVAA